MWARSAVNEQQKYHDWALNAMDEQQEQWRSNIEQWQDRELARRWRGGSIHLRRLRMQDAGVNNTRLSKWSHLAYGCQPHSIDYGPLVCALCSWRALAIHYGGPLQDKRLDLSSRVLSLPLDMETAPTTAYDTDNGTDTSIFTDTGIFTDVEH